MDNLPDYAPDPQKSRSLPVPWYPKVTGYRLLVIVLTAAFGLSKALVSYNGRTFVPITIEWVYGVVVSLALYWLGLYETTYPELFPRLFEKDYAKAIRRGLGSWYLSPTTDWQKRRSPALLTPYRVLVTGSVVGLGLTKAVFAYAGYSTVPTTLDWVSGTFASIG
ncbi:hypothetical protein JAAARDRAFT_60998 [Jaapia argillacea MUCL 33604]|uniref:Uncharacterized protein n=1 Tax=Jaapia argillacea MUCL 33604 TaxID=933084 RepID=A0A067PGJ3_9AGAM|nr:hypothetical protein JAAARDRAFT_60998 [Jaapia argillacea MUCL 33604]